MTEPLGREREAMEVEGQSAAETRTGTSEQGASPGRRIFVRGPWEMAASILIGLGVVMLMQPFVLWLYTYSFLVILTGTILFLIVSHFPGDEP